MKNINAGTWHLLLGIAKGQFDNLLDFFKDSPDEEIAKAAHERIGTINTLWQQEKHLIDKKWQFDIPAHFKLSSELLDGIEWVSKRGEEFNVAIEKYGWHIIEHRTKWTIEDNCISYKGEIGIHFNGSEHCVRFAIRNFILLHQNGKFSSDYYTIHIGYEPRPFVSIQSSWTGDIPDTETLVATFDVRFRKSKLNEKKDED